MRDVKQITFLLDRFAVPSPGQQLLDRLLLGFPHAGRLERPGVRVAAWLANPTDTDALRGRVDSYGLAVIPELTDAVRGADAVIVAGWEDGPNLAESAVRSALNHAPEGTPVFVYGLLARQTEIAGQLARLATQRQCRLLAGTATPFTFRLPPVDLPEGARVREGLIIVQGPFPSAEIDGLEGLLPLLERRRRGEVGIERVRRFDGDAVWQAGEQGLWSWSLMASALSRSDTPQGNAVADGRTEDLVGLGLVQKLARKPRGWTLQHRDGLRSTILVLDGVVADINFAIERHGGGRVSAQLFRPLAPQQEHYSQLVAALTEFFATGRPPWPLARSLLEVEVIEQMSKA